ncbi:MAG: hypothetical protein AB7G21_05655, partial [Dehalococcoidia bacterium]
SDCSGAPANAAPLDGSVTLTLCGTLRNASNAPLAGVPITFTASTGYLSTGTSRATTALTNAQGLATTSYRGAGEFPSTDTVIASNSSLNLVSTWVVFVTSGVPPVVSPPSTGAPTGTPTEPSTAPPSGTGTLAAPPTFDGTGRALSVFTGGSVDDLVTAASGSGATGIWVQDAGGTFQLFIVGGPDFLAADFRARFPAGWPTFTSVLLVR